MKMRVIKLRSHDAGMPFPYSSGQASTKPKHAQQRAADRSSSFASINEVFRAFWAKNGQ